LVLTGVDSRSGVNPEPTVKVRKRESECVQQKRLIDFGCLCSWVDNRYTRHHSPHALILVNYWRLP